MEDKKETINENPNNSKITNVDSQDHEHCQCHQHQQPNNNNNNKSDDSGPRKQKLIAKLIFVPLIMIKIFSSYVLYILYYCYNLKNETDIKYSQFAITIFAICLYISYFLSILTPPTQTNADKYTTLNQDNTNKKEIIKLNQSFIICEYCQHVKFNRSSHCRVCAQCMSFRDHHCLFINNCVGFNNIQYFVSFLFWGSYAIIFDMYVYLTFTYLQLSLTIKIISLIDFLGNLFFICNIGGIFVRSLLTIYNNRTYLETQKQFHIERKCPFFDLYKEQNKLLANNPYNIGFLSHFYYAIGPSLLHFFLPLNKFKTYTLDENCPLFCKAQNPDNIQMLQFYMKSDENYYEDKIMKSSDPDLFMKLCHKYYDGYNII